MFVVFVMGIDTLLAPVDVGVEFLPMRKGLLQHKWIRLPQLTKDINHGEEYSKTGINMERCLVLSRV